MMATCEALLDDLDKLARRISGAIASEVTEFGASRMISHDDLWQMSRATARAELEGLTQLRPPGEDELRVLRVTGRRAYVDGLSLRALVDAYHVGQRELWRVFLEAARHTGHDDREQLLTASHYLMDRMIVLSSAAVDGYQKAAAEPGVSEARAAAQLVRDIDHDPESEECRLLARRLGFEPDRRFRALAVAVSHPPVQTGPGVVELLRRLGCVAVGLERGATLTVILQGLDGVDARAAIARLRPPAGVGLEHQGLSGARESILEASEALSVGVRRGTVCWYERDWLIATALGRRAGFEELLAAGVRAAREHPHLAEAVRAFARCRFSVAEAARALFLSRTGAKSRLIRWVELTGFDLWTFDGLSRSLLACDLADAPGEHEGLRPVD